jgi:putative component of membrane protein insertase Oxa1/YidC/SpoIIIJ protein YidD
MPPPPPETALKPKLRPWLFHAAVFCLLASILTHLGPIALAGIGIYRRDVAPALHIHCAYARATGSESCSAFTQRAIAARGFFGALPGCFKRFTDCAKTEKGTSR